MRSSLPELSIVLWGGLASAVWEFAQSPLYADHGRGLLHVLRTRLHCAGGDVLILLAAFYTTSLIFRTRFWFLRKGWGPPLSFITLGLAYTVWSEWFNTQVALSWEYAPEMPRVAGIGLAPVISVAPGSLSRSFSRAATLRAARVPHAWNEHETANATA